MAEYGDAASCRRDRARDAPKDGRLSRPVRPAERDTLARLELEIEAIDDVPPTEAAREALHREDEFARQASSERPLLTLRAARTALSAGTRRVASHGTRHTYAAANPKRPRRARGLQARIAAGDGNALDAAYLARVVTPSISRRRFIPSDRSGAPAVRSAISVVTYVGSCNSRATASPSGRRRSPAPSAGSASSSIGEDAGLPPDVELEQLEPTAEISEGLPLVGCLLCRVECQVECPAMRLQNGDSRAAHLEPLGHTRQNLPGGLVIDSHTNDAPMQVDCDRVP